jgi:membrane protein implicated in regulation of membrane protease activity
MANVERAMQIKGIGALICKLGLVFMLLGAFLIFLGTLLAGFGSSGAGAPGHMAILSGVAVALYLGFLPAVAGALLWLGGAVWQARASRATPHPSSGDQGKTIIL